MEPSKVASQLYHALKGIFCVYKPADISTAAFTRSLKSRISRELNKYPLNTKQVEVLERLKLDIGGPRKQAVAAKISARGGANRRQVNSRSLVSTPTHSGVIDNHEVHDGRVSVTTDNSLTDHDPSEHVVTKISKENSPLHMDAKDVQFHPLVLGNLWKDEDIHLVPLGSLATFASGVMPYEIRMKHGGCRMLICKSNPIRVYRAVGTLGITADDFLASGPVIERAKHRHVTQPSIERVLAGIQASHQKLQFAMAGIDIQSQKAYEMASSGLVRPDYHPRPDGSRALLYGIRLVDWQPPEITIEIHCVNECGEYLAKLVHDIGIELRCGAVCATLRRLRYGHFDASHCLVHHQLDCETIIKHIEVCRVPVSASLYDRAEQISLLQRSQSRIIPSSVTAS